MPLKTTIRAVATVRRLYARLVNVLLGPAGRASGLIADRDACLVGLYPRPFAAGGRQEPFFKHLRVISSH
jgi:hypothetical protein